jgi:ankyrin repeat protein
VNVNAQDEQGNNALSIAVKYSTTKTDLNKQHFIIKYLLENGADVYQKNKYNYNVLEIMRGKSHYDDIVKIFNNHGYDVQKTEDNSNITSEKIEEKNLIKNPNQYKSGATLLYHALLGKDIAQIKLLLECGADINKKNSNDIPYNETKLDWIKDRNKTALEASIDIGNIEIIELLMKYNADINILLRLSIEKNNYEILELLLQKGANPNHFNSLAFACENQNLKMVKLLMEYKADTNYVYDNGRTPLFAAIEAKKANKEIIRFLIANGADIHKEDNSGISPLSFAESSKVSLVKVLTELEEVKLSETQDPSIVANYQNLLDKIVLQNNVINKLKDEVQALRKSDTDNQIVEDNKSQRDNFKETILSQSNEIKELQNQLITKEHDTKNLMDDLMSKINKLEEKIAKQRVVKTQIPLNIPTEKQSIKKDDGVIVKRESFDDF